ncbi:methyltransferase domain-containing protein [Legionella sp. MW5194]|uniref:class I SAM-dependent methyltransferase n=1 Tax=Legionella sp. MW5194 TaxID=2662448 RepID=UPI00193E0016|nr:class I SAM-dependent methyltransferase [Legionella sp. MW5194]QRN03385.1 methyltransferase domain-containing protein [Legionella sp. MW5194]
MLLCPDCYECLPAEGENCDKCSWKFAKINNISQMLSSKDRSSPLFTSYIENYEKLANDDLSTSLIEDRYIEIQADKIFNLCPALEGKDYCDIGSGRGFLLKKVASSNPNSITAVDVSLPYLHNLSNSNYSLYQANAENLPFKERFDVITCTDIMEHVINLGGFLHSLQKSLKPQGTVIIRVPYKENLIHYAAQNGCKYEFAHLRDFDKKNIKRLLRFCQLKIQKFEVSSFSLQTPQYWWLKNQKRMDNFMKFQRHMRKKLTNDSDINLYNSKLLRLFLRPLELTVVAQKIE